ncbi:DUF2252 domain-containing protein [Roseivivax sp. CAU 1761]
MANSTSSTARRAAPKRRGATGSGKRRPDAGRADGAPAEGRAEAAPVREVESRVEEYRALAARYVESACTMRPCDLDGQARRRHVRSTIVEDHAVRIDSRAQGAETKFAKLAGSLFSFFRGTSLLFHRDMAGEDARMPTVLVLGDVHPGNFGVMPNADNVPIFGVNDFDDVIYGPFTWDLKRGTTGFMLAASEKGGYGRKKQRKIARKFLKGYAEGMAYYARHNTESSEQMRPDNSPKVIRKLFEEAYETRAEWLRDRYLDETGRGFRANEELTPITTRCEEFQGYIDALAKKNGIDKAGRTGSLKVKDVALRHGQGTASLGLPRYYCLIEGPSGDATDDLIIEFKRARRSALEGLVPAHDFHAGETGDRIAHGQSVHLAKGDVFYGACEIDGDSFMSRERAPFRDDVDMDDLSGKSWKRYARACGRALAQAHARSDDAGKLDYRIEPRILEAMAPQGLFIDDMLAFAEEALARLERDHAFYRQDLALGAFDMTEKHYR